MEISPEVKQNQETVQVPDWYSKYQKGLEEQNADLLNEVQRISEMDLYKVNAHIGGNVSELPYEVLQTLFIDGTDDNKVAQILRDKRSEYLKSHPEEYKGSREAGIGVITYNGGFVPQSDWESATPSERRGILVGSTCFHYNSGTPGMDSNPNDRW